MLTPEYTLAALKCAALRVQLQATELDLISMAVRGGLISPEAAMLWVRDCGLLDLVGSGDAEDDRADMLEPVP